MPSRTRSLSSVSLAATVTALLAVGAIGALAVAASPEPGASAGTGEPGPQVALAIDCATFETLPALANSIQLPVGADLTVTLCSNASTGFSWADPVVGDASVLALSTSTAAPAASPLPGAPGTQTFVLSAVAAGTTSAAFSYGQSFSGGQSDVWTVSLAVTVGDSVASQGDVNIGCDTFGTRPRQSASVDLAVGETLSVVLCSNASTGFTWGDPKIPDATVLSVAGKGSEPASSPLPGAAGTQNWALHADAAGTTTVRLKYSQPWKGGVKNAWSLSIKVTVH